MTKLDTHTNNLKATTPQPNHFELITPEQFESLFGVKQSTQAVWRSTGRYSLPYYKVGRLIRYKQQEVDAWLDARLARRDA